MKEQQIIDFLKIRDYDIRKTQNARWIDQKCTPDVLSIVADCILEFTQYNIEKSFSIRDIWDSPYTNENIKPYLVSSMSRILKPLNKNQ
ncbi:hypothetical protein BB400_00990 [Helicobacter pylori]|uniref:hypothetical protein n=1 Tax=Helicobacter pylori TaxID=210 RepID=UPI000BE7B385|nr:hypothetical protein [Helicobacter pylori]PDX01884.1 hypothetical protein BB400_00990 [Helicobacter pylori]WQU71100.1 hypothetical protein KVC66_00270 [Helicobacter pylori]